MNRHTRLLVAFLLAVLVILAAAIVVFHMNVNKETTGDSDSVPLAMNADGSEAESFIFEDETGLFGLKDENGNVILDAEWAELEGIGNSYFKARLVVRSDALYGVIDNEGDIIVPFVYDAIDKQSDLIYTARLAKDGKYFFYDPQFRLIIPEAADSFSLEGTLVHMEMDGDEYVWRQGTVFELMEVKLHRFERPVSFTLDIDDYSLVNKAGWSEWRDIADILITFLNAYRLQETESLPDITDPSSLLQVESVFSDEYEWNGGQLSELYIYNIDDADGTAIYFETEIQLHKAADNDADDGAETEPEKPWKLKLAFKENSSGEWKLYEALVLQQES